MIGRRNRDRLLGWLSAASIRRIVPALAIFALLAAAGCGSSSDNSSQAEIEAAKKEGEVSAHERDRVNSLQKQVHSLKHQAKHGSRTVVVESAPNSPSSSGEPETQMPLRVFYAPSGNVSCEILVDGAICSVASVETTFSFRNGEAAHIESGTVLSRESGEFAPYGTTITEGSISCVIPNSDEPRGITCSDSDSGHGFEASRESSRQQAY